MTRSREFFCTAAIAAFALAGCGASNEGADLAAPGGDDGGVADFALDDAASTDLAVDGGRCPPEMVQISTFCVDRFEAHVVELDQQGAEHAHSPFDVVDNLTVRAKSAGGVYPQGYISQLQATQACQNAGKRLCNANEFALACRGDNAANYYPYGGTTRVPGYCNEGKGSSVARFYGTDPNQWTYAEFNAPILNQWDGGLAPTGSYPHCVSPYGVYDCVGNLHEWGDDAADANGHGRFRGGFYGDAEINGHGCRYVTSAHELSYHDYSTGFRCCSSPQ